VVLPTAPHHPVARLAAEIAAVRPDLAALSEVAQRTASLEKRTVPSSSVISNAPALRAGPRSGVALRFFFVNVVGGGHGTLQRVYGQYPPVSKPVDYDIRRSCSAPLAATARSRLSKPADPYVLALTLSPKLRSTLTSRAWLTWVRLGRQGCRPP
jgi:hypothetical protein